MPAHAAAAALIALDWGTTSLRAYLLAGDGGVLDRRAESWGVLRLPDGGFPAAFDEVTRAWRSARAELPAVACGMVGSAQGWVQAPYVDVPADAASLARRLVPVDGRSLWIVPGLAQRGPSPDVMRGEETQLFGALSAAPALAERSTVVMPGTHSKWARVASARIEGFATYMTGELFAVLRSHSILGRLAGTEPASAVESRWDAFDRGVRRSRDGTGGLARVLFSARSSVLAGDLEAPDSIEYLSGLLIGDEIRSGLGAGERPAALIGEESLCRRYARALEAFGVDRVEVLGDTAPAGLWEIARAAFPPLQRAAAAPRRPVSERSN